MFSFLKTLYYDFPIGLIIIATAAVIFLLEFIGVGIGTNFIQFGGSGHYEKIFKQVS